MFELLSFSFMQRALAAGIIVGLITSYLGIFVVQRNLSFLGEGLAHAALGGIAIGVLLGSQPTWVALPFAVAVALLIVFLQDYGLLSGDAVIGVVFSVAMAGGVVLLAQAPTYNQDLSTYLFGSILSVGTIDLWTLVGALVLVGLAVPLWGRWSYATFDPELAAADRVPVRRDNYLLAGLIAVVVVVSIKVVGIVLTSACLVIPAAGARLLSGNFQRMTWVALSLGLLSAPLGLATSYFTDAPSGATIVLIQGAFFTLALAWHRKS